MLPDFDLFEKMENAEAEMTPNLIQDTFIITVFPFLSPCGRI